MSNTDFNETALSSGDKAIQAESSTALPQDAIEASRRRAKWLATIVLIAAMATGPVPPPFTRPYSRRRDEFPAESSTLALPIDPVLLQNVKDLFEKGAAEFFHDGMDSNFSRSLLSLLGSRGADALSAIAEYLSWNEGNPEAVSEALRWMAEFGGPDTLPKRWSILCRGLRSQSPVVRDGAILGFATLDDPRAHSLLLEARESEQIRELQLLIERVAARLEHLR
jgi:hypothetical protein